MTDYIEEMMKTAGILGDSICSNCDRNAPDDTLGLCCNGCLSIDKEIYPSFTAEKQLEIIKLIGKNICKNCYTLEIETDDVERFYILSLINQRNGIRQFNVFDTDFTQALAQLTIELMDSGELDKSKVKEILE